MLYEVEALTREIVLIHRGRVLAEGNVYRLRELIDRHPTGSAWSAPALARSPPGSPSKTTSSA
ncbi:MAG: hypothetical protein IPG04_37545 [Polyangiaceae bacterium]|nr:hypothetical protein [Polyangiaceae bacterium]